MTTQTSRRYEYTAAVLVSEGSGKLFSTRNRLVISNRREYYSPQPEYISTGEDRCCITIEASIFFAQCDPKWKRGVRTENAERGLQDAQFLTSLQIVISETIDDNTGNIEDHRVSTEESEILEQRILRFPFFE